MANYKSIYIYIYIYIYIVAVYPLLLLMVLYILNVVHPKLRFHFLLKGLVCVGFFSSSLLVREYSQTKRLHILKFGNSSSTSVIFSERKLLIFSYAIFYEFTGAINHSFFTNQSPRSTSVIL